MAVSPSIWSVLGVRATTDVRTIRRAYAERLKVIHPEDDSEGFQRLRHAYDWAMRAAQQTPAAVSHAHVDASFEPAEQSRSTEADATTRTGPEGGLDVATSTHLAHASPEAADAGQASSVDDAKVALAAAQAQNRRLREALLRELRSETQNSEAMQEAFSALVRSSTMEVLSLNASTEAWLAEVVGRDPRAAEPILTALIGHFGWTGNARELGLPGLEPVLRRGSDLKLLYEMRADSHPHHDAFKALRRAPRGGRWVANRLEPGLAEKVRAFLEAVRTHRISLLGDLNPEALAWWDARLSRPHIGAVSWFVWAASSVILVWPVLMQTVFSNSGALVTAAVLPLAMAIAFVLVNVPVFAIAWPKTLWRRLDRDRLSPWARFGWVAGFPLLICAAAMAPPSAPVTIGLAVLAALNMLWALASGEPDKRLPYQFNFWGSPGWLPLWLINMAVYCVARPGRSYIWWCRAVFNYAYLGVWAWIACKTAPVAVQAQALVPLLAAAVGFSGTLATLEEAWLTEQTLRRRKQEVGALLVLGGASLALLALGAFLEFAWSLGLALSAIVFLLHKIPAQSLRDPLYRWRDVLMKVTLPVWIVLTPFMARGLPMERSMALAASLWLMTGVVVTAIAELRLKASARA